jgi:hypothetical protein
MIKDTAMNMSSKEKNRETERRKDRISFYAENFMLKIFIFENPQLGLLASHFQRRLTGALFRYLAASACSN